MIDEYYSDEGIHIELPKTHVHHYSWDIPPWYRDPQAIMGLTLIIWGITFIVLIIKIL